MADWFRNRVLIINNGNSEKGFKELSQIFSEYDEAAYEDFLGFIDCPLTRFIMGKDDITIKDNEIQFGIISAYRPVFELENICSKFNCDVHVVYAHERETLTDWEGGPSIGRFSACLKNGEITYEKKSPDSQNNKEIHEYFSMAWDGNMSPDPIDSFTFFDQNKIGSGFFIKESEDDEDGFPPDFKQWLGLEEIDAPYGFIGYAEMENDLEDEEDGIDYEDEDFTIIRGKLTTYKGSASEVIIPEGVTSIGDYAFEECTNLQSIKIPDSVTSIGDVAFSWCTNLQHIEIPDSVTSIGEYAFEACINLQHIEIPDSVTSIGDYAFNECTNLQSIEIPDSVTSIGECAFVKCTNLQSIKIPNSVISIGDDAFGGCTNLQSIKIPDSVTSIGKSAFRGTNLQSIKIPEGVTSIGEWVFEGCTDLRSIEIPDSVTSIGECAFMWCTDLRSIEIPDSVTSIGDDAFYKCTNLQSIEIPNSVISIGKDAFGDCENLTVTFNGTKDEWNKIEGSEDCDYVKTELSLHALYINKKIVKA